MSWRINEIGPLLRKRFGRPVRKLCLQLGATCPNRDGTIGRGGCLFCGEPEPSRPALPLEEQVCAGLVGARRIRQNRAGVESWRQRQRRETLYIAYFQDHTATHRLSGAALDEHLRLLESYQQIIGVIIGTRPDCLPDELLKVLSRHASSLDILIELGLQTANERTLSLLGRQHTAMEFSQATRRLHQAGLRVGAHVILGLPKRLDKGGVGMEDEEDARASARLLTSLQIDAVKIHNCYVLQGTRLAELYRQGSYRPPGLAEYGRLLADFLVHLPATIEVHRLLGEADSALLLAPEFTADKGRALSALRAAMAESQLWQGQALGQPPPGDLLGQAKIRSAI